MPSNPSGHHFLCCMLLFNVYKYIYFSIFQVSVNPTSSNIQHPYFKNEKDSNVEDGIPAKITIIDDVRSDEELVKNGEWNLVSERKFITRNNF